MIFSSLKNRLRSRTRVTTVMFQNAWCFEESAPFSYTYRNFQISECVTFEESAPFSYTYHNFSDEVRSGHMSVCVYPASHCACHVCQYSRFCIRLWKILRIPCLTLIRTRTKSGSGALGPKSVLRGSRSITFANVLFSAIQPSKILS